MHVDINVYIVRYLAHGGLRRGDRALLEPSLHQRRHLRLVFKLESQLPHKIVNLLFTIIYVKIIS